ncbi:DUF3696 domain-containing protein [uncultured Thiocystis sp.]|uniref:DUF3696 domain-containing protein n=1 Tax=uncultured Thiocystis sp. TaxID=1202134 RepID=UPI0025CF2A17|nr:DUF3696 domain-containing protein [uncultured Thiocystis sp.]
MSFRLAIPIAPSTLPAIIMTTQSRTYLTRLHLENFKSIKGPSQLNFAPITLLFGPNSAGKSSVFDAIRQVGTLCRAGDPILFDGPLRRAVHNHDHRLDMSIGVSAFVSSLPPPIGAKTRSAITNDFAEQHPRLVKSFYSVSGDDRTQAEIDVRFTMEFDQDKNTRISWLLMDEKYIGDFGLEYGLEYERGSYGFSWVTEISVNSVLLIVLTSYSIYYNQDHQILKDLDAELEPFGYNLQTLHDLFWGAKNINEFFVVMSLHEFRRGEFTVDDEMLLGFYDGKIPYDEFRRLFFIWRGLQNFLVHTPLDLIANAVDSFLHLGPVRKIPQQEDLTFLVRDDSIYATIQGQSEWNWVDGGKAWYTIARDFNERLETGDIEIDGIISAGTTDFTELDTYKSYLANRREKARKKAEAHDSKSYPGIALGMINDWLCSPQRLGLKHRLLVTLSEYKSTFLYPSLDGLKIGDTAAIPQRIVLLRLIDESLSMPVNFNEVGAGIPQIIPVLAVGLLSPQSFIEQPELHLHPKLQTEIGDFFVTCMNRFGHFFVLETHSEHLALRLLRRIRETTNSHIKHLDYQLKAEDVAFFFFDSQEDGTEIVELRVSADGEFLDRWPKGFFAEREAELFSDDD